jgi:hypothetical protein
MDPRTQMYLHMLERRLDGECQSAQMRVRRATTMAEVVRATSISVPPELRALRNNYPSYRQLKNAAERKLEELLDEQLKALKDGTLEQARQLFAGYQHREWQSLRGTYATLYRRGEIEARRILHGRSGKNPAT